jgi:hypothetical protein
MRLWSRFFIVFIIVSVVFTLFAFGEDGGTNNAIDYVAWAKLNNTEWVNTAGYSIKFFERPPGGFVPGPWLYWGRDVVGIEGGYTGAIFAINSYNIIASDLAANLTFNYSIIFDGSILLIASWSNPENAEIFNGQYTLKQ